jgi:hypothetical protein
MYYVPALTLKHALRNYCQGNFIQTKPPEAAQLIQLYRGRTIMLCLGKSRVGGHHIVLYFGEPQFGNVDLELLFVNIVWECCLE